MKNTIKVFVLVALTLAAMRVSAQAKLGHIETQKLIRRGTEKSKYRVEWFERTIPD
mgnify:CR=1 FL=1